MTTFLYFVPGVTENKVDVKAVGLEYAFDGSPAKSYNTRGFDGEGGSVLAQREKGASLSFDPPKQTWKEFKGYWVGYWNNNPPTEEALRRDLQLRGKPIRIREEWWTVPIARSFELDDGQIIARGNLSRYWDVNKDGEFVFGDVEERLRPLWDAALQWWDFVYQMDSPDEDKTIEPPVLLQVDLAKLACVVMGFNYRIGPAEMAMLHMLSEDTSQAIMDVAIDREGFTSLCDAMSKKNRQAENSTTSGGNAQAKDSHLLPT